MGNWILPRPIGARIMTSLDSTPKHMDLVFDVGMHKGEDSELYLKKGFRVVGFEADPDLAAFCRSKFKKEVESGKLIIVEGAVVPDAQLAIGTEKIKFYKNLNNSVWGTVCEEWAQRNERSNTQSIVVEVVPINFFACLKKFGVPHYMKVDIEGMDLLCIEMLAKFKNRPDYISLESEKVVFSKLQAELKLLESLGYHQFRAVQQATIIPPGSSGPFGADLPESWKDLKGILREYRWIFFLYKIFGDNSVINRFFVSKFAKELVSRLVKIPLPGWYDTHARHSSFLR